VDCGVPVREVIRFPQTGQNVRTLRRREFVRQWANPIFRFTFYLRFLQRRRSREWWTDPPVSQLCDMLSLIQSKCTSAHNEHARIV
jgi:hypothetical protein